MPAETPYLVVLVAAGSGEEARTITRVVVERKLAACAQILPIQSVYEWEGAVVEDDEILVLLKTHADAYSALHQCIVEHHSYDVPEILALPVQTGHDPYLQWVRETTRQRT